MNSLNTTIFNILQAWFPLLRLLCIRPSLYKTSVRLFCYNTDITMNLKMSVIMKFQWTYCDMKMNFPHIRKLTILNIL